MAILRNGTLASAIVMPSKRPGCFHQGGMFVSAIFTLILMPSVLRLPPLSRPLRRSAVPTEGVTADA